MSEHRDKAKELLQDVWSPGVAATIHALLALGDACEAVARALATSFNAAPSTSTEQETAHDG